MIGTGLILSFEPWLVVRAVEPNFLTPAKVEQLLSRHDPGGQARAIDRNDRPACDRRVDLAAKHVPDYKGMPVGKMIESIAMSPIEDVEKAVKAKDRFAAAVDKLTTACNSCHQSANRPFIVIQRPSGSAFPNQSFSPRRN